MPTALKNLKDDVKTTLASGHTSGDGTLVLAAGAGATMPAVPFFVTVITAATYRTASESRTHFVCTARSTDTLTVSVVSGSTDANYSAGAIVEPRYLAAHGNDLAAALNTAEAALATAQGDITSLDGRLDTAEADIDALQALPAGSWAMTWGWSGSDVGTGASPYNHQAEAARVATLLRISATDGTCTIAIETSTDESSWSTLTTLSLASGTSVKATLADLAIPADTFVRANRTAASGLANPKIVLHTRRS